MTELTLYGKLRCEICLGEFDFLGKHVSKAHNTTALAYKKRFHLNQKKALMTPDLIAKMRKNTLANPTHQTNFSDKTRRLFNANPNVNTHPIYTRCHQCGHKYHPDVYKAHLKEKHNITK